MCVLATTHSEHASKDKAQLREFSPAGKRRAEGIAWKANPWVFVCVIALPGIV